MAWLEPAEDGCIVWTGARNARGYGRVSTTNLPGLPKVTYAHRVAYYLATGQIPALLRHTCDNPSCCNTDHLLPGTHQDNMRDAVERGQIKGGPKRFTDKGHPYWTCKCEECTSERQSKRRAGRARRAESGPPPHTVGSANYYTTYYCRCELCVRAVYGPQARPKPSYPYVRMSLQGRTMSTTPHEDRPQ